MGRQTEPLLATALLLSCLSRCHVNHHSPSGCDPTTCERQRKLIWEWRPQQRPSEAWPRARLARSVVALLGAAI